MLLTPNRLSSLCHQYKLAPSKKYGQNYLISEKPIKKMIEAIDLNKKDKVVEIGPGFGILTFQLAEKVKKVIAFEIEKKLEKYWNEKIQEYKNIEIVWGNALKNYSDKVGCFDNYKLAANLPYQITSRAIRTVLESNNPPTQIALMVQLEVAERVCAKPGDMSLLSVSVQYFGKPEMVLKVARGSFWPEPKVDSALIKITPHKTNKKDKVFEQKFFSMVKAGFSGKRKQLAGNLSRHFKINKDEVVKVLEKNNLDPRVRAEELGVEHWIVLTNIFLF